MTTIEKRPDGNPHPGWGGVIQTFTREELLEALALRPCHVTGMHEPGHHTKYTCQIQKAEAFDRVLALLGIGLAELPRRLHDEPCWSCHEVPSQEEYRERNRETHRWAGVEIPPELAAPAPDHPQFDKTEEQVLAALRETPRDADGYAAWEAVREQLGLERHTSKMHRPLGRLREAGRVEVDYSKGNGRIREVAP